MSASRTPHPNEAAHGAAEGGLLAADAPAAADVAPRVEAAASVVVGVEAARAVSGVVVVEVAQVVAAVSAEGEDEGVDK